MTEKCKIIFGCKEKKCYNNQNDELHTILKIMDILDISQYMKFLFPCRTNSRRGRDSGDKRNSVYRPGSKRHGAAAGMYTYHMTDYVISGSR